MKPTGPATGYGYLKLGRAIDAGKQQFKLDAFVEKPDLEKAQGFIDSGQYAWNSGMFMFKATVLLKCFAELQPEILSACKAAMPAEAISSSYLLDQHAFSNAPSISIDYAIMERASNVATVVADMGWSDVGDWDAVWQASDKDMKGVVVRGNAHAIDCKDSIVQSCGPLVLGLGLDNMIAIGTRDAVLVAPLSRSQDVKKAVDALAELGRSEATSNKVVVRPWGWYESIHSGPGFQVKEIAVKPGAKLSLQRHKFRAEQWVCIMGRGIVTRGDELINIEVNQTVDIPLGAMHRLENISREMLHIIEVQLGAYTGEDDIERFDDIYGRT